MYEVLHEMVERTNADISVVSFCHDSDNSIGYPEKSSHCEVMDGLTALREVITNGLGKGKIFCGIYTYLVSRHLFDNVRFPVGITNGEDRIVGNRLFYNAEKVVVRPYKCYHYCLRTGSATRSIGKTALDLMYSDKEIDMWVSGHVPELRRVTVSNGIKDCLVAAFKYLAVDQFDNGIYHQIMDYLDYYNNSCVVPKYKWRVVMGLMRLGRGSFYGMYWLFCLYEKFKKCWRYQ